MYKVKNSLFSLSCVVILRIRKLVEELEEEIVNAGNRKIYRSIGRWEECEESCLMFINVYLTDTEH